MSKKLLFNFNREVIQNYTYVKYVGTIITATNTLEKPIKSAILSGSTKYRDIDTGEFLETFEEGRNLELVSVRMPVLTTVGKNLFSDDNTMELGAWGTDGRPVTATNEIRCKNNYIPFPKGLKNGDTMYIVLSDTTIENNPNMYVYDHNRELLGVNNASVGNSCEYATAYFFVDGVLTITINDASKCGYFSFRAKSSNTDCRFAIMVNTSETVYEDYKTNILTVNEPVELRGIGDVRDELDLLTGEVTTKYGEMVIDGREEFIWGHNWASAGTAYPLDNPIILDNYNFKKGGNLICEQIQILDNYHYGDKIGIHPDVDRGMVLVVPNELTGGKNNVAGLRAWLNENPITIVYELNQQSIKTVDLSILDQNENKVSSISSFNDTTHITASSETIPPIFEGYIATKEVE